MPFRGCARRAKIIRFLFGCAASLSLLLLIGTVVVWGWCRWHSGYVRLHAGAHFLMMYPAPNAIAFTSWNDRAALEGNRPGALNTAGTWPLFSETLAYFMNRSARKWKHVGVQWSVLGHLDHGRTLVVPNGMLMGLFAILPLWWAASWNRSRKRSMSPKDVQIPHAAVCA